LLITIFEIIFWISSIGLIHTYVVYPKLLYFLAKGKKNNKILFQKDDDLPFVSVLMAAYNEDDIIAEKLKSLFELDYPIDKIHMNIGSDCSSDQTNPIVEKLTSKKNNFTFFPFKTRRGKPNIINELIDHASKLCPIGDNHILLLTDASVMIEPLTLFHLVKHFKNPKIGIVDSNILNTGLSGEGISKSENQYIRNEVMMKHYEGLIWGNMIGPLGGCYAIRSTAFTKVPPNFLVDDFYICMKALEMGVDAINDLDAICHEPVPQAMNEEYRRKRRISSGNFQNLRVFKHLLRPNGIGFAFFSHKVLRWMGPFFIILIGISLFFLFLKQIWYFPLFFYIFLIGIVVIPLLDFIFKKIGLNNSILRNITYFNYMNLALLEGFLKYYNGIKNSVWEPPKRQ